MLSLAYASYELSLNLARMWHSLSAHRAAVAGKVDLEVLSYSEQSRSPSTLMVAFGSLRNCRLFLGSILISLLFTVPSAVVRETVNLMHLSQRFSSISVSGLVPSPRRAQVGTRVTVSPD